MYQGPEICWRHEIINTRVHTASKKKCYTTHIVLGVVTRCQGQDFDPVIFFVSSKNCRERPTSVFLNIYISKSKVGELSRG